jgi:hypothetical protein
MMKWFNTETPVRSPLVVKLMSLGHAHKIMKAIQAEKKSNNYNGHSEGITVKRIGYAPH